MLFSQKFSPECDDQPSADLNKAVIKCMLFILSNNFLTLSLPLFRPLIKRSFSLRPSLASLWLTPPFLFSLHRTYHAQAYYSLSYNVVFCISNQNIIFMWAGIFVPFVPCSVFTLKQCLAHSNTDKYLMN